MRRAARVDTNHGELFEAAQQCGFLTLSLAAAGKGIPDALWCFVPTQTLVLVEIKQPSGKLTPLQQTFCGRWPVVVVRTPDDVIALGRQLMGGGTR